MRRPTLAHEEMVLTAFHLLPHLAPACTQGSMKSSYLSPSPPISGRDISALAVIRRPSWSGAARTGSYDGGSTAAAGGQVIHACSVSHQPAVFILPAAVMSCVIWALQTFVTLAQLFSSLPLQHWCKLLPASMCKQHGEARQNSSRAAFTFKAGCWS